MGRKPCCSKEEVSRGAWSFQEDQILINYINTHGQGKWRALPLNADVARYKERGDISKDEEDLIIRLHTLLGKRWSLIAGRLPGRTDNEIKNYCWNTYLAKRQKSPSIQGDSRRKTLVNNGQKQVPNNNSHIIRTKAIRYNGFKPVVNNQDQIALHSQIAETDPNGIEIKMDDRVVEEKQKMGMNLMIELKKMASFLEV